MPRANGRLSDQCQSHWSRADRSTLIKAAFDVAVERGTSDKTEATTPVYARPAEKGRS